MTAQCPRCLELEDELRDLRQRLAARGQYVMDSLGPNTTISLDHELHRWLAVNPGAEAADGFRAGWSRLARWTQPRLRELEQRYMRAAQDNTSLRSHIGTLLMEISRLRGSG